MKGIKERGSEFSTVAEPQGISLGTDCWLAFVYQYLEMAGEDVSDSDFGRQK